MINPRQFAAMAALAPLGACAETEQLASDLGELCVNLGDAVIRRRSVLACW